jgi:hypothetical protein
VAEAVDALGELAIAPTSARIDKGRLVGAPGLEIALDNVRREVVIAGEGLGGGARKPALTAATKSLL